MMKIGSLLKKYKIDITIIVVIVTIGIIVSKSVVIAHISGNSMSPTYADGDILIMKKNRTIKNGDMIIFNSPEAWNSHDIRLIKRVIAQEGDIIHVSSNFIQINNETPIYTDRIECENQEDVTIELSKNQYFVMGDNINNSNDSLSQFCLGNENFFVENNLITVRGRELLVLGGK